MLIPINNHNGNNMACLPMLTTATHIKLPQSSIPKDGNNGENGTLKGLSLSGSVFLKIKTPTQDIPLPCLFLSVKDMSVPIFRNGGLPPPKKEKSQARKLLSSSWRLRSVRLRLNAALTCFSSHASRRKCILFHLDYEFRS